MFCHKIGHKKYRIPAFRFLYSYLIFKSHCSKNIIYEKTFNIHQFPCFFTKLLLWHKSTARCGGVQAIAGASHWQFVAYKKVLHEFLPFSMDRPMGQVRQLDQRMNEAGYLRLMISDPLAMNMSNTLRNAPGQSARRAVDRAQTGRAAALLDFPPVRKALLGLYDAIFRWYYDRQ